MKYLPLIAIYATGVLGYCSLVYIKWRMLTYWELYLHSVNWKIALPIALVAMPIACICMYLTTIDFTLLLNRELGFVITSLTDMYGPNGEILR